MEAKGADLKLQVVEWFELNNIPPPQTYPRRLVNQWYNIPYKHYAHLFTDFICSFKWNEKIVLQTYYSKLIIWK